MSANDFAPETATARRPGRALNVTLWVLQILLAIFIIAASAAPKLIGHESAAEGFDLIGWGDWFMYAIGAVELAGGVGLLVPRLAGPAAIGLSLLMVGAAIFNATVLDYPVYTPLILLVLFVFIAWGRRDRTRLLFSRGSAATA
ncbi:DoxX family protein [Glycomyces harbinensis]|uniref:DoxX-like family protein n=1 Tax=Glycomyces harbinensis TaxID=58114 RepID=A0A1G6RR32_9ACTN|nr:DoxX family protein [Glycomyces harbinensis]SDD07089.1 DoxX-like family protein [Glycomyces harbinensis]